MKCCFPSLCPSVCSSRAESKCSQRQQKALSSTVHRLSENLKQLQQENSALREELATDSPAGGIKGAFSHNKTTLTGQIKRHLLYLFLSLTSSFTFAVPPLNECFQFFISETVLGDCLQCYYWAKTLIYQEGVRYFAHQI